MKRGVTKDRERAAPEAARHAAADRDRREQGLFVPGRNCWRVERAERFRCVQDAAEYFRLVRAAILSAQHSIFILGWDILASADLLPGEEGGEAPTRLAQLLDFVVQRNPALHCFVLIWDYAAVYALERDPFSRFKLGWGTHRRVHFRYDDQHPYGASHHQKIVVVDDRIAFSGGLDLTGHRWDTPEHRAENPLRKNAMGQPYEPFHDVQALMEGPVAVSLGELARERWRRSHTGLGRRTRLPPVAPVARSLWPAEVDADITDVDVAIARTEPEYGGHRAVRECELLYLDVIAAARRTIYVENQYFTNMEIGQALARRLAEPDGPEIIVVGPKSCSGWLEQKTMGQLRHEVLTGLLRADVHGRLRLLYALASRELDTCTFIHSKVTVIDDQVLRIGSANLSSRSMGMDTECDVAVAAEGDEDVARSIRKVRDRLLAEHLGADAAEIAREIERAGSVRAMIDARARNDHTLERIDVGAEDVADLGEIVRQAADPHEPMLVTRTVDRLLPAMDTSSEFGRVAVLALPLCAIGATWVGLVKSGYAETWIGAGGLRGLMEAAPDTPSVIAWALGLSVAGALCFVPLEILALCAVVLFGPLLGGPLALAAALLAALIGYAVGRAIGPQRGLSFTGRRAYRVWRQLPGRGATAVAALRMVSVFSATSIHFLCGAARVPLRSYAVGTLIAFVPGILALSLLGGLLRRTILEPGPWSAALTMLAAGALALIVLFVRRRLLVTRLHAEQENQAQRAVFG